MIITNAKIVTPGEVIEGSVVVEDGWIEDVAAGEVRARGEVIDARSRYLLPGLVDIHGDDLEFEISPRPFVRFPVDYALINLDRKTIGCGITTKLHAISNYEDVLKGRDPEKSAEILRTLSEIGPKLMANHWIHARCEVRSGLSDLFDVIDDSYVKLVSVMDHMPGSGQFQKDEHFKKYYQQAYGMNGWEIEDLVRCKGEYDKIANVARVVEIARGRGIPVASHDDDSQEMVEMIHQMGAEISEFPVTISAARTAKELGMMVSMGAPNTVRGRSSTGNLSALDAIHEGLVDILCSDYNPASMLYAPFVLFHNGLMKLAEAVKMVSLSPARAIGINGQVGSIEAGKRADLVMVDEVNNIPVVSETIVGGVSVYSYGRMIAPSVSERICNSPQI